jgi:hypothetical protein
MWDERAVADVDQNHSGCSWTKGANMSQQQEQQSASQTSDCCKGPLKGKGEALRQWHRQALDRLDQIYRNMETLRDQTKQIEERRFSLDIYSLNHRGSKVLRWRLAGGRHATWDDIEPHLAHLPASLAQWYREVEIEAQIANAKEKVARHEVKTAKQLIEKLAQ